MMRRYLDPDLEHKNKPRYGSLRGEEQESCTEKQVLKRRLFAARTLGLITCTCSSRFSHEK